MRGLKKTLMLPAGIKGAFLFRTLCDLAFGFRSLDFRSE